MKVDLSGNCTQSELGTIVGVSQSAISAMMAEGNIPSSGSVGELVAAYCQHMRTKAAERLGSGLLDLVQERASLAKEQRISHRLKNETARSEYAPTWLLADALELVSGAVVDRIYELEGAIYRACPTLPDDAHAAVIQVIASARREWIRSTSRNELEALAVPEAREDDASDDEADSDTPDEECLPVSKR